MLVSPKRSRPTSFKDGWDVTKRALAVIISGRRESRFTVVR